LIKKCRDTHYTEQESYPHDGAVLNQYAFFLEASKDARKEQRLSSYPKSMAI
jgi:hypothetical protein